MEMKRIFARRTSSLGGDLPGEDSVYSNIYKPPSPWNRQESSRVEDSTSNQVPIWPRFAGDLPPFVPGPFSPHHPPKPLALLRKTLNAKAGRARTLSSLPPTGQREGFPFPCVWLNGGFNGKLLISS